MKGIINYKIVICERGEIPMHYHQTGKYIIKLLNFPSLKNEVIRRCSKKPNPKLLRKKRKKNKNFTDYVFIFYETYYICIINSINIFNLIRII